MFSGTRWPKSGGVREGYILRLDKAGKQLSYHVLSGGLEEQGFRALSTPDGGAFAIGQIEGPKGVWKCQATRLTADGKVAWNTLVQGGGTLRCLGVGARPGGGWMLAGRRVLTGATKTSTWIGHIGAEGKLRGMVEGTKDSDTSWTALSIPMTGWPVAAGYKQGKIFASHLDAWGHAGCATAKRCATRSVADCDDADKCTSDFCDPAKGCVHYKVAPGAVPGC